MVNNRDRLLGIVSMIINILGFSIACSINFENWEILEIGLFYIVIQIVFILIFQWDHKE